MTFVALDGFLENLCGVFPNQEVSTLPNVRQTETRYVLVLVLVTLLLNSSDPKWIPPDYQSDYRFQVNSLTDSSSNPMKDRLFENSFKTSGSGSGVIVKAHVYHTKDLRRNGSPNKPTECSFSKSWLKILIMKQIN